MGGFYDGPLTEAVIRGGPLPVGGARPEPSGWVAGGDNRAEVTVPPPGRGREPLFEGDHQPSCAGVVAEH